MTWIVCHVANNTVQPWCTTTGAWHMGTSARWNCRTKYDQWCKFLTVDVTSLCSHPHSLSFVLNMLAVHQGTFGPSLKLYFSFTSVLLVQVSSLRLLGSSKMAWGPQFKPIHGELQLLLTTVIYDIQIMKPYDWPNFKFCFTFNSQWHDCWKWS